MSDRVTVIYGTQTVYPSDEWLKDLDKLLLNQEQLDALADAIGAGTYPYAAPAAYRENSHWIRYGRHR